MRFDAGEIRDRKVTANGYLRCDGFISRTGVFTYRLADGSTRRELRLPSEVFRSDSLATFEDIPLTNGHPREPLNAKNTRRFQSGIVRDCSQDGKFIGARVVVTDADTIAEIESGKRQLSCGYDCDLEVRGGVTLGIEGVEDGLQFDAIQRNIVGNHVAIVDVARGGPSVALHLDEEDAVMIDGETKPTEKEANRMKVRIDGVDYDIDDTAGQAVSKVVAKLDQATETIASLEAQVAETKARADKSDEDLETERKAREDATTGEAFRQSVKARVALETKAAAILSDDTIRLDELTDDAIKRAVVIKVSPTAEAKLNDADDVYVSARFDAAVESWESSQKNKPTASDAVKKSGASNRADSASARQRMIEANRAMGVEPIRATTPEKL